MSTARDTILAELRSLSIGPPGGIFVIDAFPEELADRLVRRLTEEGWLNSDQLARHTELLVHVHELATVIEDEIPGEPSQSQGAIDTAIRLLRAAYVQPIATENPVDEPQTAVSAPSGSSTPETAENEAQTMRLLLDMDGPLADFDRHFYDRCEGRYDFDVAGVHEQTARYFTDHIPNRKHRTEARQMIDAPGWFRDLPVTPGALEGVSRLLSANVDVWVCSKPLEVNSTCRDDKGAWLRQHFPMLERKLILAPDKSLIVGDVLLDDAPNRDWFAFALWRPVVFTAPFNGSGSAWEHLPHWSWSDPLSRLTDDP